MKSILLHIHDDCAQDERLAVAIDLARAHKSHLTCVQITSFSNYVVGYPLGGTYVSPGLLEAAHTHDEEERARIEQRLTSNGVSWDWERVDGHAPHVLVSRGRLADVLILSRRGKASPSKPEPLPIVAEVAVHVRAPVLVVPPGSNGFHAERPVMIAWNGSMEAAHSLRLVLPFLRMAASVHIVTVSDDWADFPSTSASLYLARHDVASELHEWPRKGRPIAQALSEAAEELGVTALVMGAYGHSRFRETVVGGVTHDLLEQAKVPLLMGH